MQRQEDPYSSEGTCKMSLPWVCGNEETGNSSAIARMRPAWVVLLAAIFDNAAADSNNNFLVVKTDAT